MFDNIGDKIKLLAKGLTVLGIILSIIYGIVLIASDEDLIFIGFLVIIVGSSLFWIGSVTLYGFGEMINQLEYSNKNTYNLCMLLKELVIENREETKLLRSYLASSKKTTKEHTTDD